MSMTMEQVVSQLQQEAFNLRAQVAAESGLADAVRAMNNLATARVRKDTPSLTYVKGPGRPKEFTGREEDFQQWSKKTGAFFAGVIRESEMMLEWAAEQPKEIMTTAIDLAFLPKDANEDRGVQNMDFMLQQMHTALMALTSYEVNDTVANWRKNPLDDETKLAGLESLVPEELEKHLILNSIRLRTFEDARLEVVTYVEAKFGLRIS